MTQTPMLHPAELTAKQATLAQCAAVADGLNVTAENVQMATALVQTVLRERDALEEMRTSATKPLNASLREVNGWFKAPREACDRIAETLKGKITAHLNAVKALETAAYQAAAAAHRAGQDDAARAALVTANAQDSAAPQGTHVRNRWVFIVRDPSQLPRQFLTTDVNALNLLCAQAPTEGAAPVVPGVEFRLDSTMYVRR
jgi:hypothetical protein